MMTAGMPLRVVAATDWYMLKAGGRTIGQIRIDNHRQAIGKQDAVVTEISNTGHFQREGDPFELNQVSRFVENPQTGKPLRFSYAYQLGPQTMLEATGEMAQDGLALQMQREDGIVSGKAQVSGEQFLFPGGPGLQKVYSTHYHDKPGSRFRFQTLHLGVSPAVVDSEVRMVGTEKIAMADGNEKTLRKFEIRNPSNQASTVYEWRDAKGKLYKAHSVGDNMEMVYASQRLAGSVSQQTLDLVSSTEVYTNVIPQPRITTEALYRIAPLTGESLDLHGAIPDSFAQTVLKEAPAGMQRVSPDEIYLRIVRKEPTDASAKAPAQFDRRYLDSTPYLQATDAAIERQALDVAGDEKRAYFATRALQQWVFKNIANKNLSLGFATAKDTLLRREGDCTEHAVLLAAMSRALGIPSRVAIGLLYLPDDNPDLGRFVYHMWTEVYIGGPDQGEWVPLDATLPETLPDAARIKIADSPLANADDLMRLTQQVTHLAGRLRIDVLRAMSSAESMIALGKKSNRPDNSVTLSGQEKGILNVAFNGATGQEAGQGGVINAQIHKSSPFPEFDVSAMSRTSIKHYRTSLIPDSLALDNPDGLFTHGVERLSKGDYDAAVQAFRQALDKLRKPVEFYRMGEQLAAVEMDTLAAVAFQRAAQDDPAFNALSHQWLQGYLAPNPLPDSVNRKFMAAVCAQIDQEDFETAAGLLREVIAEAPDFAPAHWHLGQVSTGTDAVNALNTAVALAPGNFRYQETLGDVLMTQKKYGAAANAYQRAVNLLKPQAFPQEQAWIEALEGKRQMALGTGLLAHNRKNPTGWLQTGKGLLLQNRFAEAAQALQNALALQPAYPEAQLYRFQAALQNSDWKTLDELKGVISAQSTGNALAASLLGQAQMHFRQYGAALQSLQRATAMAPGRPEAYLAMAEVYQRLAGQAQNVKTAQMYQRYAENALRRGYARIPSGAGKQQVGEALAELLLSHSKTTEAQPVASGLLTENPANAGAYRVLGQARLYGGDLTGANEALEMADLLNPNQSKTLTLLGQVAMEQGREPLAVAYYQKAHKANPSDEQAAHALRKALSDLQMAGKKPPVVWNLTPDEQDFLIQLLTHERRRMEADVQFLTLMRDAAQWSEKDKFSIRGIEELQARVPSVSRLYNMALADYTTVQGMKAPPSLKYLHYLTSVAGYRYLEAFKLLAENSPLYHSPKEADALNVRFARLYREADAAAMTATVERTRVLESLPLVMRARIVYEAHLDELDRLLNEEKSLMSALNEKRSSSQNASAETRQATPASTAPAPSKPVAPNPPATTQHTKAAAGP
jgi:tetratricopeptide (TPR) repeat protein